MVEDRILVTGASGYLGSHLVGALGDAGFGVIGVDRREPRDPLEGCERFHRIALQDAGALGEVLDGIEVIAHCASIHPWKEYADGEYIDCNIHGTWSLYSAAAEAGIAKVVLTSSIAAGGYHSIPRDVWPVAEDRAFPPGDLYSLTKRAQEETAGIFSDRIRTLALRPPAFMPMGDLEVGFHLTGCYAVVGDIVRAHMAAVEVLCGLREPGTEVGAFEPIHVTNALPYTREDARLMGPDGDLRPLVKKYWPGAYRWLRERGYDGGWLPAVYDLSRARRILGWEPEYNFEDWLAEHGP